MPAGDARHDPGAEDDRPGPTTRPEARAARRGGAPSRREGRAPAAGRRSRRTKRKVTQRMPGRSGLPRHRPVARGGVVEVRIEQRRVGEAVANDVERRIDVGDERAGARAAAARGAAARSAGCGSSGRRPEPRSRLDALAHRSPRAPTVSAGATRAPPRPRLLRPCCRRPSSAARRRRAPPRAPWSRTGPRPS